MPRYFFDIHDGGSNRDDIGTECADDEAARLFAIRTLPDIASDEIPKDGDRRHFVALITNESGQPIFSATLSYVGVWLKR